MEVRHAHPVRGTGDRMASTALYFLCRLLRSSVIRGTSLVSHDLKSLESAVCGRQETPRCPLPADTLLHLLYSPRAHLPFVQSTVKLQPDGARHMPEMLDRFGMSQLASTGSSIIGLNGYFAASSTNEEQPSGGTERPSGQYVVFLVDVPYIPCF